MRLPRRASAAAGAALGAAAALALALAWPGGARAHIVHGASTLHELVAGAEWVVRARIEALSDLLILDEAGVRRPVVEARVLEVLKAPAEAAPTEPEKRAEAAEQAQLDAQPLLARDASVRFAQHGHGVPEYQVGEEAVVFLIPVERSRELAHLAGGGALRFVSLQEHDDKLVLAGEGREALLAAVRAYAGLASLPSDAERFEAFRRTTLSHLESPVERVAESASRDLLLAAGAPLLRAGDVPRLEALVANPERPIGVRLAVLADLVRRGLVEGAPRFVTLLQATRGLDRVAAIHAAGAHPSEEVTAALAELLAGEDAPAAEAAAVALAAPAHAAAVPALARALRGGSSRLQLAAVRGLGGIATPEARAALAAAAAEHPEPATRRRAVAELRVLAARDASAGSRRADSAPEAGAGD